MNWRRLSLVLGIAAILAGIGLIFGGYGSTVGGGVLLAGILATIVGSVPDTLITIFRIPELRTKIFITLALLGVYRIGYYIPLPMVDQQVVAQKMADAGGTTGRLLGFVSM